MCKTANLGQSADILFMFLITVVCLSLSLYPSSIPWSDRAETSENSESSNVPNRACTQQQLVDFMGGF